jgi:hypothetical protein
MVGSVLIRYSVLGTHTSGRANKPSQEGMLDCVRIKTTLSRFRLARGPPRRNLSLLQRRDVRFSMTLLAAFICLRCEIDYVTVICLGRKLRPSG